MRFSYSMTMALLLLCSAIWLGPIQRAEAAVPNDNSADDTIVIATSNDELTLTGDELETNRGAFGINTISSSQTLAASTSGNSLNVGGDLTNGNIAVGDNLGGFGSSYVMNTGNNTTINAAVSLNVQIMPTP